MNKTGKIDKYLDLVRELKNLQNMKVTVTSIVVDALVTIPQRLKKRQRELKICGRIKIIQNTVLLRLSRIKRILETWEDFLNSDSSENSTVKKQTNSQGLK